jgi:hypothetical protein
VNRQTLIRDNVLAQLRTLAFDRDVVIDKIAAPSGINALIGPVRLGVSSAGDRWVGGSEIDRHTDQPAVILMQITIWADDATSPTASIDLINDVAFIALQVRDLDVGIYGIGAGLDTGGVYMDALRADVLEISNREPGGAGPIAKVFTFQSTELPL